ncbi:MAG: hypothetical protein CM1200mP29_14580 [Verrucomicrobiota bacterium]|nr:MAG: hypothetical protein CM1200mP29_14580 [Verrucomicrobiota bacterium]
MAPLWGYKGNYYEGVFASVFRELAKCGEGREIDCRADFWGDIYPTFLDLAKAKRPDQPMDGESLLSVIRGEQRALGQGRCFGFFRLIFRPTRYHEQRDPLFRTRPCSAVGLGNWKLHEYFEDGALELYNLKTTSVNERTWPSQTPGPKGFGSCTGARRLAKENQCAGAWKPNPDFEPPLRPAVRKFLGPVAVINPSANGFLPGDHPASNLFPICRAAPFGKPFFFKCYLFSANKGNRSDGI